MPSISRDQFVASFQGRGLDLANLSPELKNDLNAAGITVAKLEQIAGVDGIMSGEEELARLFKEIDTLDRDGSYRSIALTDTKGGETRAGALLGELQFEIERNRLRTAVGPGLHDAEPARAALVAPKTASSEAPWLDVARGEIGQREKKGAAANNARIVEYHATTSGKFTKDETPWCSSFVNWVMEQSGKKGTDSARATSWKDYGTASDGPAVGAIAVIDRGNGKGHVGFVIGRDGDNIVLLGGNQKNSVRYSVYPEDKIAAYRLPPGYQPPPGPLPEMSVEDKKPLSFKETR